MKEWPHARSGFKTPQQGVLAKKTARVQANLLRTYIQVVILHPIRILIPGTVVHGHNLLVYTRVGEFYRCIWRWSPLPPLSNNLTPVTRWCFDPKAWVLAFTNRRVSLCPGSVHGPLASSQWGNEGEAEQAFFWKVVRSMPMLLCRVENPCANLLYHLASSRPNRLSLPYGWIQSVETTASTGRNCKGGAQTHRLSLVGRLLFATGLVVSYNSLLSRCGVTVSFIFCFLGYTRASRMFQTVQQKLPWPTESTEARPKFPFSCSPHTWRGIVYVHMFRHFRLGTCFSVAKGDQIMGIVPQVYGCDPILFSSIHAEQALLSA